MNINIMENCIVISFHQQYLRINKSCDAYMLMLPDQVVNDKLNAPDSMKCWFHPSVWFSNQQIKIKDRN